MAYLASNFVSPDTASYFQALLRNDTGDYMANIATWADSVRYTKWGRWSGPLHYIDAKDSPPSYCGVELERDCKPEGCVVTAIQNYTSQLLDGGLRAADRNIAAKFVIHFVGDIHQPLHAEDVAKGGNGLHVTFEGAKVNLHHVWDTRIAEKMAGGVGRQPYAEAKRWADALATEIRAGKFNVTSRGWLDGTDLADPVATALLWARESNEVVCTAVLPEGPDAIEGQELAGGPYFDRAAPVIEVQVAKAGYRLAAWLDLIVRKIRSQETMDDL